MEISLEDIVKAKALIHGVTYKTALLHNPYLSNLSGNKVYVKMENLQRTGSFKLRGAYNKIAHLTEEERQRGVIS